MISSHVQPYTKFQQYDILFKASSHVETVVLLRGVNIDSHINVDLDVEKLNLERKKAPYGATCKTPF